MTEFTPGPWCVKSDRVGCPDVYEGDGSPYKRPIATVLYWMGSEDAPIVAANARLIAAAPMLYEALVNADYAVWYMANNGLEGDMIDWEERFNQLTEAIALVKGE